MNSLSFYNCFAVLLTIVVMSTGIYAQNTAQLLINKNKESSQLCYDVSLKYEGNERIMIASQNYRFFYSSVSLEFDPTTSGLLLPHETYTYRLVQHQNHVDGSSIGKFEFDNDLGFINASVVLNNTNSLGAGIDRLAPQLQLLRLCFDVDNNQGDYYIIPAREALTKEYGRAYIDVSYVDEEGQISSLNLSSYEDIHITK